MLQQLNINQLSSSRIAPDFCGQWSHPRRACCDQIVFNALSCFDRKFRWRMRQPELQSIIIPNRHARGTPECGNDALCCAVHPLLLSTGPSRLHFRIGLMGFGSAWRKYCLQRERVTQCNQRFGASRRSHNRRANPTGSNPWSGLDFIRFWR